MNFLVKSICFVMFIGFFLHCGGKAQRVMVCDIPQIDLRVELWELKHYTRMMISEYKTWFVVKRGKGEAREFLIDERYIEYRLTRVFVSEDYDAIRIETSGVKMDETRMIAEYLVEQGRFSSRSEPSVYGKEGWILLKEKRVH